MSITKEVYICEQAVENFLAILDLSVTYRIIGPNQFKLMTLDEIISLT